MACIARAVPMALVLAASLALAFDTGKLGQGGTIMLDELMPLFRKSEALQREIAEALGRSGKKHEDVICSGMRFPGSWGHLGGMRVSPYTCDFGGRWLSVKADVRITGPGGRVYDTVTSAAMKNATTVSETNLTWSWLDRMP
jgi:hypothetical protein